MADDDRVGTVWSDEELDAIVADYFDMLDAELNKRPYVKSHHSAALMERIGRTHRSVEFKHQNISAVLEELGMPWIPGYEPKRNYQNAIFDAIDRYLSSHGELTVRSLLFRMLRFDLAAGVAGELQEGRVGIPPKRQGAEWCRLHGNAEADLSLCIRRCSSE